LTPVGRHLEAITPIAPSTWRAPAAWAARCVGCAASPCERSSQQSSRTSLTISLRTKPGHHRQAEITIARVSRSFLSNVSKIRISFLRIRSGDSVITDSPACAASSWSLFGNRPYQGVASGSAPCRPRHDRLSLLSAGSSAVAIAFALPPRLVERRLRRFAYGDDRIDAECTDIIRVQDTITQETARALRSSFFRRKDRLSNKRRECRSLRIVSAAVAIVGPFVYHTVARVDIDQAIEPCRRAAYLDPSCALTSRALGRCLTPVASSRGLGRAGRSHPRREAFYKSAHASIRT